MQDAQYIYGCTMRSGSFDAALGAAAKVDCIARIDVRTLVRCGIKLGIKAGGVIVLPTSFQAQICIIPSNYSKCLGVGMFKNAPLWGRRG